MRPRADVAKELAIAPIEAVCFFMYMSYGAMYGNMVIWHATIPELFRLNMWLESCCDDGAFLRTNYGRYHTA